MIDFTKQRLARYLVEINHISNILFLVSVNGQRDSIVNVIDIQNRKMPYSSLKSEETCLF